MRCEQWPFRPIHITNDGDKAPEDSPLRKLSGPGIIANHYLQGIQSAMCHDLGYPTTIIEFSPEGETVRTDSPLLTFQMHFACRHFRQRTLDTSEGGDVRQGSLCLACDACHARLFWRRQAAELATVLPAQPPEDGFFNVLYSGSPTCEFHRLTGQGDRTYLFYDCPLLGYREALFPIMFEGSVIAVFFLGQMVLEHKRTLIEERIRTLLGRHPDCFDEFIKSDGRAQRPEEILDEVLEQHRKCIQEPKSILTMPACQRLLSRTCEALARLEEQLRIEMHEQRQYYIGGKVTAHIEQFRKALPPDVPEHHDPLEPLWTNVQHTMEGIVRDFALRCAVVFGVSRPTMKEQAVLDIVARAGSLPEQFRDPHKLSQIKLELPEPRRDVVYSSRDLQPEHLKRLRNCDLDACGDIMLVFFPVPLHPQSSIGILIGYPPENPSSSLVNAPGQDLDRALQSFDSLAVSSLSAILATTAERYRYDQLRILGHEAGQLITGLDWMRVAYLKDPVKLRQLEEDKAHYFCRDLEGLQKQLSFIFDRAALLTGELPPLDRRPVQAFGELLYKWKDIYRLEALRKALQFLTGFEGPGDPSRPPLFGDPVLLEQVFYNVVNNAVKYCYRGTKIHVDCRLRSSDPMSPHVLTVTDYGRRMPDTKRVYDLYARCDDSGDAQRGLGIGLYLARQIALAHGGRIWHESEKVSEYNVPLIEAYINAPFRFYREPEGLRDALRMELERLERAGRYGEVIARTESGDRKYCPSFVTLASEINRPTYKVTVTVEIPRH